MDHFGPIRESMDGFKHILVIVDAFSRFTWLAPTKTTNSREVIRILSNLFHNFSFPAKIITDRGTAFSSSEFTKFIENYKIKHHLVAVAAPWANGLVERINRFLKSALKKVVDEDQCWNIHLDTIQYVINNTYHTALKSSPSKILLGIEQRNHADVELVDFLNKIAGTELDCQKDRQASQKLALEATNKIKRYNKIYYDNKHKKPSTYKEGDLVLIRDTTLKPGDDRKLKANYKGPYLVKRSIR